MNEHEQHKQPKKSPSAGAKRGRPALLDDKKKRKIVSVVSLGASQRCAASQVGCSEACIRASAKRDRNFAQQLRKAKFQSEIKMLNCIRSAAQKDLYWRAAAWMLERNRPQRYARRGPDVITAEQIAGLLMQFAEILTEEVPVARYRKPALRRLKDLSRKISDGRATAGPLQLGYEK